MGELSAHPESQATEVSGAPLAYEKETYRYVELDGVRLQELDSGVVREELAASPEAVHDTKIARLVANSSSS